MRCSPFGIWGSREAPSLPTPGFPSRCLYEWVASACLTDLQPDGFFSDPSLQLHTLGWACAHLYFWISKSQVIPKRLWASPTQLLGFAQPKYLPSFSSNLFPPPALHHVATLTSLSLAQLHACSLPDTLLPVVHSTPSLPKIVLGLFLHPSSLLSLHCCGLQLRFPCLSCFSSTVHVPSPAGHCFLLHPLSLFRLLMVHVSPQLTISVPDLHNFPRLISSPPLLHLPAPLRTNPSPTFPPGHSHVPENVQQTL